MVNEPYRRVVFQPTRFPENNFNAPPPPPAAVPQAQGKFNEYVARGLAYIQYINRMLKSSSSFFEKYSPVIQEVPKMYHLAKAFNELKGGAENSQENNQGNSEETNQEEIQDNNENKNQEEIQASRQPKHEQTFDGPGPTLFI